MRISSQIAEELNEGDGSSRECRGFLVISGSLAGLVVRVFALGHAVETVVRNSCGAWHPPVQGYRETKVSLA